MTGEDADEARVATAAPSIRVGLDAHAFPSPPGPVGIAYPVGLTGDDLPKILAQARAWVALLEQRATQAFPRLYAVAYWALLDELQRRPTQDDIAAQLGFTRRHVERLRKRHAVPLTPPRPDP